MEYEDDIDTYCSLYAWNSPQRIGKKTGGFGNQRKNQYSPDHSIVKIV